jgi:hypothetical protein
MEGARGASGFGTTATVGTTAGFGAGERLGKTSAAPIARAPKVAPMAAP